MASNLSIKNLFFSDQEEGGDMLEGGSLVDLETDIKSQLPKVSLGSVQKEMGAKIGEVLNVGLDEVLASAWKKYKGLQEYTDPAKHPPEETALVPLAKHAIKSAHKPHVDLKIKNTLIGSIQLEVLLLLQLEGVVLKVQAGRILDLRGGACQASGSLKCQLKSKAGVKDILSLKKETPKFQLPGAFDLGAGIPIPPAGGQAAS